MKRLKIENISNIKLDFFLKQNNQDVRVVLEADESTWCDLDSNTKSMILYERKNLIRLSPDIETNNEVVLEKYLIAPQLVSITPSENPIFTFEELFPIDGPTEEIIDNPELRNEPPIGILPDNPELRNEPPSSSKTKTYKGKRRGPKKKRGPKPGMAKKKKKLAEKLNKESEVKNDNQNIQDKPENI